MNFVLRVWQASGGSATGTTGDGKALAVLPPWLAVQPVKANKNIFSAKTKTAIT
jgi:hypothetical protein